MNSGDRTLNVALTIMAMLILGTAQAQTLPLYDDYKHMGPATCASSVCHGQVTPDETANVWLNEYRIWSRDDYHSRAFSVLRSDESMAMAEKLGLGNPTTEKVCLDCHTDNVPVERRGEKFQISDGVGCEACHGGAEKWIESHAEEGATREDNLARGMYPTDQPEARARLCLSCHVGTQDRFADHDIMAAGHPRMSFELETFTVNQPAHYEVDEGYIERKGNIRSVNMWSTGMVKKAKRQLELIQSERFTGHGIFPELAFFDCHACHHPMDDQRMQPTSITGHLPPGMVRLDDSSFQMLLAITSVVDSNGAEQLQRQVRALHTATTRSTDQVRSRAASLESTLDDMVRSVGGHDFSNADMQAIRATLLERASRGEYHDFTSAEQAFLAVETLSIELDDYHQLTDPLDAWFDTLADEHQFSPGRFASVANQVRRNVQ